MKWEYTSIVLHTGSQEEYNRTMWDLNTLGNQGWEAIGMSLSSGSHLFNRLTADVHVVLLKRPLPD